jgi:hypothetical protein
LEKSAVSDDNLLPVVFVNMIGVIGEEIDSAQTDWVVSVLERYIRFIS